jgi:glycosyltransferase involved in cell wall biosynthesis
MTNDKYLYTPLAEPVPISEQIWPQGTTPLVSTSTLAFNHGPYIRDCLEGILMQRTTFPVRVCIFDDFSTDGTRDIIKEYESNYPNIFYVVYASHNTYGKSERLKVIEPFRKARKEAKFIALCEGDDYWTDPLKLQKQVKLLEQNPECSISFHSTLKKTKSKEYVVHNHGNSNKIIDSRKLISGEINMWTASILVKTDVIESIPNNLDYLKFGDAKLKIWAASLGNIAYVGGGPMSVYRRGVKGAWSENEGKDIKWEKQRLYDHYEVVKVFKEILPIKYHKALNKYWGRIKRRYFYSLPKYYSGIDKLLVMIKNLSYINYNIFDPIVLMIKSSFLKLFLYRKK